MPSWIRIQTETLSSIDVNQASNQTACHAEEKCEDEDKDDEVREDDDDEVEGRAICQEAGGGGE